MDARGVRCVFMLFHVLPFELLEIVGKLGRVSIVLGSGNQVSLPWQPELVQGCAPTGLLLAVANHTTTFFVLFI